MSASRACAKSGGRWLNIEKSNSIFAVALLRLSKNGASSVKDRAAGEREGARPASQYNNPPQKSLEIKAFRAKQHFDAVKMLGG